MAGVGALAVYAAHTHTWESRDGESHAYIFGAEAENGLDATAGSQEAMIDSLSARLERDYVLPYPTAVRWVYRLAWEKWYLPRLDTIQPGYYRLEARQRSKTMVRRLSLGLQSDYRLTIGSSLRTLEQVAGRIGRAMQTDSASVMASIERLNSIAPEHRIAIFIPNTYYVHWTDSANEIVARMQKEYERFWNDERCQKAAAMGLKPIEVVTLASIVNSETHRAAEWPAIASLYLNRYRKGMLLQADPTAVFATRDFGTRRVLHRHTHFDSPYNTYIYRGLPPGPIRCAQPACIDSVLVAPKTDYIYMCANPDWSGTHLFTGSYIEHMRNARAFQRELNRRHIRR